jgi:predicted GNAT family acetyltransferase
MSDFRDNEDALRYERPEAGGLIFADYEEAGNLRRILYVETPPALRGKGLVALLMQDIVAHARAHDMKLKPICPYAVAYAKRHRDAADVFV